jgi:hypothetical protein
MKLSTLLLIILPLTGVLSITRVSAQANASINILTQSNGQVALGGAVFVQVDVGNTGPTSPIGVNKVRAQISIPIDVASALPNVQQTGLPAGWAITVNSGDVITVCNGTDIIGVNETRTILIAVHGDVIGGPSTITGVLRFSNGVNCAVTGTLAGDNPADNTSTSTIEVVNIVTPVTLTNFDAALVNCQPVLHWITETEINSDRFEIERSIPGNSDWQSIGTVAAHGNTTTKLEYTFADRYLNTSSEKVLYRLKMFDKDEKYKYSRVLPVLIDCNSIKVSAYPNPVQDGRLYISLTGASGYTESTLLSLSGQLLIKSSIHNGTNYLNTSAIPNGLYVLNIKDAGGINKNVKVRIQD